MGVEVVHWNPIAKVLPMHQRLRGTTVNLVLNKSPFIHLKKALISKLPFDSAAVNNFGDLIGPMIIQKLKIEENLIEKEPQHRLLTVGSILHLAESGDTVWGAGAMYNLANHIPHVSRLDIRAVRGPITRSYLLQMGHDVPEVYGDPALLLGYLWNRNHFLDSSSASEYIVIPHHSEVHHYEHLDGYVSSMAPLDHVLSSIASTKLVISSSLHGLIVADALGVPSQLLAPKHIDLMKFWDYYLGTGRSLPDPVTSVEEALVSKPATALQWDPGPLLSSFPRDLWKAPS